MTTVGGAGGGGGGGPSLQVLKDLALGPAHVPCALRQSDRPSTSPFSLAPMLVDVWPAAGLGMGGVPTVGVDTAVKTPSYESSSTTVPAGFTSAMPSRGPFWIPSTG